MASDSSRMCNFGTWQVEDKELYHFAETDEVKNL